MSFVQIAKSADTNDAGTTAVATQAFGSPSTAANVIAGHVSWQGTLTTDLTSVTDGVNTYAIIDRIAVSVGDSIFMGTFVAQNIAGGGGALVVTAHFGATVTFRRIEAIEYSGVATTGQPHKHAIAASAAFGTGTDAVSSGAQTTTIAGCTIYGVAYDESTATIPAVGTGFTSRDTATWTAGDAWRIEDKVQGSAGSVAATFTITGGTESMGVAMLALAPSGATPDQPQDGDSCQYEVEEDYDEHTGTTEPIAFGGNQTISQSYEAEWADEDYDAHDGSTDPVVILAALVPPPIQSYEADFLWNGDDDLDIIDDYANFTPDQPQDEIPEFIDDDYDHHIGEDQPQYLVQVQATTQPQDVVLEDEDDYEHHQDVDQPQYLNVSPLQNFDPILEFEEEDYDPPDVSVDAQAIVVVVAPDVPQSFEAEWSDEDYDDPDVSTGQATLGGDNNIPQSFEALWDEEDYDAHDGSGEGQPATIVDNNIPQSFVAEWDEEDYDEANGSTDPQPVVVIDNNIPQSYEAEWAEEDYQEDDTNVLLPLVGITTLNLIPGKWTWTGISVTGSFTPGGGGGGLGVLGPLDWPPNYVAMLDDNGKDVAPWVKWFNDVRQRVLDLQTIIVNSGIASPFFPPFINVKDETGAYTLVAGDWDPKTPTMIRMNSAAPQNLTFPAATVGAVVGWMQYGTGALTLVGTMGVTLRTSGTLTARVQYSSGTALMVSATEWLIEGDTT